MKKSISVMMVAGFISMAASAGCVVRAQAVVPVPSVTVHYRTVHGRQVLVVPASIRRGHGVIIRGQRCIVKQRRRGQIQVIYPNGQVAWVNVIFR